MKNFKRLDCDPFTVFIDTYSQPKSANTHQHEDVLSYVLYKGATPVLVDSGRVSYAVRDRYLDSSYHSGFADTHWPVRPNPRFFFCKKLLMQEQVTECVGQGEAVLEANNRLLSITKRLKFLYGNGALSALEQLETKQMGVQGRLFHIFSDCSVEQTSDNSIVHRTSNIRFIYPDARSIQIERVERAFGYGKTVPCQRVTVLPHAGINKISWVADNAD